MKTKFYLNVFMIVFVIGVCGCTNKNSTQSDQSDDKKVNSHSLKLNEKENYVYVNQFEENQLTVGFGGAEIEKDIEEVYGDLSKQVEDVRRTEHIIININSKDAKSLQVYFDGHYEDLKKRKLIDDEGQILSYTGELLTNVHVKDNLLYFTVTTYVVNSGSNGFLPKIEKGYIFDLKSGEEIPHEKILDRYLLTKKDVNNIRLQEINTEYHNESEFEIAKSLSFSEDNGYSIDKEGNLYGYVWMLSPIYGYQKKILLKESQ